MVEHRLGPGGEIIRVIMLAFARAVFEVLRQRVAQDEQQMLALTLDQAPRHTPGRCLRRWFFLGGLPFLLHIRGDTIRTKQEQVPRRKNTAIYPQFMVFLPLIERKVSGAATVGG